MIRYYVYGEGNKKPIRKTKHENDAIIFATEFRNLQQYGCMTIVREHDDGMRQTWDSATNSWVSMEVDNG